jgi:hypothetical protein
MLNRYVFCLGLLVLPLTSAYAETHKHAIFKVDIYKDPKCTGKLAGPAIVVDTSKSCSSYSYVDSKGMTTVGSQNNVRCYKNKVVFDKYPFSSRCLASESFYQGKQLVEKNHSLQLGVCQEAPSHDGPVYEKLSG